MTKIKQIDGCLAGKILRIDLTNSKIWTEPTEEYAKLTLGGRGINSLIMLNEIKQGTKWHDSENLLCFGIGSLVGTMAPGACRVDISSINVFSGGKGSANVGGFWGPELKYAGYDNIIISGHSGKPVYLYIDNDKVEIRDAAFIWGKTTFDTENLLREKLNDKDIKIALIGPAGENQVRGSVILIDTAKAAGGSGVGCVMGNKKLKAIVVRGLGRITVADPKRFLDEVLKEYQQCNDNPNTPFMRKSLTTFYANPDFPGWDSIMVTRNGQDDHWEREKKIELMNLENGMPSMNKGIRACFMCPTGCMAFIDVDKGKYKGTKGEGLWVNTIMGHACRMDISNPEDVIKSWNLTNELGLDGDYVAAGLSWIFELFEKGIITKQDTDGIELKFGDGKAFIEMIKKLAYRDGIGDLLADGMIEASQKFGKNSEFYLIHMKGQPSVEPFRIPKGWSLAVATSPVAGRHLRGSTYDSMRFGPYPRPGKFNLINYEGQAEGVYWQARTKEIEDNTGICNYVGTWSGANFLKLENFVELINAGMGINLSIDDLMENFAKIGRNLEKAFNTLHTNLRREDDLPPKRFQEEEVQSGPYKGFKVDKEKFNQMLDEFYNYWGWDKVTGLQTRSSLEKIGLKDIADKLSKYGKLIED